ncbi:MAG: GGDEF domain-containing protein [Arcobacter sp.]|uniref:GGDEF domain-containing protein n=1 Tax=Arcobacter sp. TaxID=1872629 RepID=UPI003AFFE1C9
MSNRLEKVTYTTIKNLKNQNIILPKTYSNMFESVAKEFDINFENENLFLRDLNQDTEHVEKIIKSTNESLNTLNKSTNEAREAIVNKDDKSLKKINEDLLKMKEQINFLQKELFADTLTSAYNRRWLLDQYLHNNRFQNDGFIVFIDLNKFKQINDNYGHLFGDQVLKYLVNFLNKELTQQDIDIVRYGGDEFIVLFNKNKSLNLDIDKCMKDLQIKLSKRKLKSRRIKEFSFSFSYGQCAFKKGDSIDPILEKVDDLMYKDKEDFK